MRVARNIMLAGSVIVMVYFCLYGLTGVDPLGVMGGSP